MGNLGVIGVRGDVGLTGSEELDCVSLKCTGMSGIGEPLALVSFVVIGWYILVFCINDSFFGAGDERGESLDNKPMGSELRDLTDSIDNGLLGGLLSWFVC